jgi:Na+/H+-dicarboxylate symporter
VNITGDAVVSTIVAKGEDKIDMAVFNDPDAGMMTSDELDIDEEAERELAQYAKPH